MTDVSSPWWRRIAWVQFADLLLALLGTAILLWFTMPWWLSYLSQE